VFSHSPLQKLYKGWNFWTEDAEQVQALLKPFAKATVLYGHVHQIQYNQIGNITFHSVMATRGRGRTRRPMRRPSTRCRS